MSDRDEFEAWLLLGIKRQWVSDVVCERHEGLPWSQQETAAWQEGDDFCVPALRVYGLENVQ